jgi:hypothetical protein
MKHCTKLLLAAVCTFLSFYSFAQKPASSKSSLFHNYPAVIPCSEAQLNRLFTARKGEQVKLSLAGNLVLQGGVTSNTLKYNTLQTLAIRLPGFNDILFSVTRRYDRNNRALYMAHLFDSRYADGYQLKRHADGTYQFIKIETEKMLPHCTQ